MILNVFIGIVFLLVIFQFYTTFSLENEYQFESLVYDIEEDYIVGISPYTEVDLFYQYFDLDNCSIQLENMEGEKILNGFVGNGSRTVLYDDNHHVLSSYINVVQGDYTGDGVVDENDFQEMGKRLVRDGNYEEYSLISVDIDGDKEFHINDLVLLDNAVVNGYVGLELKPDTMVLQSGEKGRLVAKVQPAYGLSSNVVWHSLNENVAVVNEAGQVEGRQEGETKIQATTVDGKFVAEAVVKVDNTIQLLSSQGVGYIGGADVVVGIKLIDYEGATCASSDEEVASCFIQDKNLVMKANKQGNTVITVTSPNYGTITYQLDTYSVYLNVMPKYLCTTPSNTHFVTVSGFHSGKLEFEPSDREVILDSRMEEVYGRNMLRIQMGKKQGRAVLKVRESNGNNQDEITIDVTSIGIPQIGSEAKVGEEISTEIVGDNLGTLSCASLDSNLASCRIEGNRLFVMPKALGSVTVEVYNRFSYRNSWYDCGKAQFLVVIQE